VNAVRTEQGVTVHVAEKVLNKRQISSKTNELVLRIIQAQFITFNLHLSFLVNNASIDQRIRRGNKHDDEVCGSLSGDHLGCMCFCGCCLDLDSK
jgi:hypothetical protein